MDRMETLLYLLGSTCNFIQGYFFFKTLACILRPKGSKILRVPAWFLCTLVSCVVILPQDPVNILLVLLLFFLTAFFFSGSWYMKVSAVMILFPIVTAVNFLLNNMGTKIFFTFWGGMGFANLLFSNVAEIIPMTFWYIFYRVMKQRLQKARQLLDRRSWLFLDLICLASLVAVVSLVCFTPSLAPAAYPCMLACIAANFTSIYLASYLADTIQAEMERKNLRLQKDYYEELENSQKQIRSLRHDMNNHFAVAESLLKSGKAEEALEYLEKLAGYVETGNRRFCENNIINALLNAKYSQAAEQGIDCFFHISIDGFTKLDDIALCSIFANTLDNAIEACCKIPSGHPRKISARARYTKEGYFSFEIINTKENEIRKRKGRFLTDKEDPRSHGLGIASVGEIVEKSGGTLDISYTEKEFCLTIFIS